MPGYGFSGKPTATGWDPARIARAWIVLMKRLGYTSTWRRAATGVRSSPSRWAYRRRRDCSAFTPTCLASFRPTSPRLLRPAPRRRPALSADEKHAYEQLNSSTRTASATHEMAARPQTLYGLADSPVGLAAWLLDHDAGSLRADRTRLRRASRRPDTGRHPRQHHADLVDEYRGFLRPGSTGRTSSLLFRCQRRPRFRSP